MGRYNEALLNTIDKQLSAFPKNIGCETIKSSFTRDLVLSDLSLKIRYISPALTPFSRTSSFYKA